MRLRNIPRADDTLQAHFTVIKNPKEFRGNWTSVFGNDRPIRIEIGMGKGRFLLNMAKTYPNINFIGIERYSSVLLRAVEKFDEDLENKTKARLEKIREQLEKEQSRVLNSSSGASEDTICSLRKEYEEKHTEYAHEILRRITEV